MFGSHRVPETIPTYTDATGHIWSDEDPNEEAAD